jgi:hypothetical protein
MSGAEAGSPQLAEAAEALWSAADACAGQTLDRGHPALTPAADADWPRKRACRNSEMAPHNLEGYWLAVGDTMLKKGDLGSARAAYAAAHGPESYSTWAFRRVLEDHEARILELSSGLQANDPKADGEMMINSAHACVACHQQ